MFTLLTQLVSAVLMSLLKWEAKYWIALLSSYIMKAYMCFPLSVQYVNLDIHVFGRF